MKNKRIVLLLAFISGITALIYQIIWIRKFSLVFGVHIFSVSIVLATFMAGLAIGSYIIGKWVDKTSNPIRLFIAIEIGIAVYGLLFQPLLNLIHHFYSEISFHPDHAYAVSHLVRLGLSFAVLIIPTTFMGGTIPILSKLLVRKVSTLGKNISLLYGANNIGAFVGCFVTGFILLKVVGLHYGIIMAVVLNLVNAIIAAILAIRRREYVPSVEQEQEPGLKPQLTSSSKKLIVVSLAVFALEGFTTLAYEIIWTRILQEFSYEKTVYFNTTIILSFIGGLGIGSMLFKSKADRLKNPYYALGLLELLVGFSSVLMLFVFVYTSPFIHSMRLEASGWMELAFREYGYYFLLLFTPALFMGMTFPLISVIYNERLAMVGQKMGIIGFLDTIGSVFGALLTGFFILPWLGVANAFLSIVLINVGIGLWLMNISNRKRKTAFQNTVVFFAMIALAILFPKEKLFNHRNILYEDEEVVASEEGISANVTIFREFDNQLALAINGAKTAFANVQDLKVHKMLAYVPALFTENPDNALVIGFGMGVTTNELMRMRIPGVEVAELSPEVVKLSKRHFAFLLDQFSEHNLPEIITEDGRSYLVRTGKKFDIITSNAVHSRLGINLYTKEFYELCKAKLTHKGVVCQWLPTNWLEKKEFYALVKSFYEVFPNTQLWYITRGHCLMVGSTSNAFNLYQAIDSLYADPEIRLSLSEVEIRNPAQFMSHLFVQENINELTENVKLNTDNHPIVEFSYNIDKKPSIAVLKTLVKNHRGYASFVDDSTAVKKVSIYNSYLKSEIQQYITQYR